MAFTLVGKMRYEKHPFHCHFCQNLSSRFQSISLTDNLDEAASVIIKSPGFPFNYPSDLNQNWTFIAKYGFRLELLEFELEEGYDFLYIRYGLNPDVPESSVITLSGSYDEGREYYIGAPEMWLFMTSDSSVQHQGFHVNVSAFDISSIGNIHP